MCDFSDKPKRVRGIATVYKVAAKRDGKFYSLAMGFEYKVGRVPVVKHQINLSEWFSDEILTSHPFRKMMVGRTAGFIKLSDAEKILRMHRQTINKEYNPCVLRVELKGALIEGIYCLRKVIAGREIVSIEEITL